MKAEKSKDDGCTLSFHIGWRYCTGLSKIQLENRLKYFKNSSLQNSRKYQKQCCIDTSCDGLVLLTSVVIVIQNKNKAYMLTLEKKPAS